MYGCTYVLSVPIDECACEIHQGCAEPDRVPGLRLTVGVCGRAARAGHPV